MVHVEVEPYHVQFETGPTGRGPTVVVRNTFLDCAEEAPLEACCELRRGATAPARVHLAFCGSRGSSSTNSVCSGSHPGDENEDSDDGATEMPEFLAWRGPPTGLALARQNTYDFFEQGDDDFGDKREGSIGYSVGAAEAAPQFLPTGGSPMPPNLLMVPVMMPQGEVPTGGTYSDWANVMPPSHSALGTLPHQVPASNQQFDELQQFVPQQQLPLAEPQPLPSFQLLPAPQQQPQQPPSLEWFVGDGVSRPSMLPAQQPLLQGHQITPPPPTSPANFGPGTLIFGSGSAVASAAPAAGTGLASGSSRVQDGLAWPPAAPGGGTLARQPQSLTRMMGHGVERVLWTVDARKLHGSDRVAVSPPFELSCGAPVTFKMMIAPKLSFDGKGGASFRKARGRGVVQLKCEAQMNEMMSGSLEFYISIGSGCSPHARWEPPRGPVKHNFTRSGICGLPRDQEEWDFNAVVDEASQTFAICLEVMLHSAA